ncbi:MAG: hypothetical protein ABI645_06580 [Pseudomonadota bacterium]
MRAFAAFAALVPLLTLPAMADRAAVDKCKAGADKTIAMLNERMGKNRVAAEGDGLQEQHREATQKRAACDKNPDGAPLK